MDIKEENTFVNCKDKNYLALGDVDGFKIFNSAEEMFKNSDCIVTDGFEINHKKRRSWGSIKRLFCLVKSIFKNYVRLNIDSLNQQGVTKLKNFKI